MKDFTYASAKKLMLEELSMLNGGYLSQGKSQIPFPPEGTNSYFFGIGVKSGFDVLCYFFFPVAYCYINESYLE